MSTITMRQLLTSPTLKADRGFNSLFAAYATTQMRTCGGCKKKKSMTVCRTLLTSLVVRRRDLLEQVFNIPVGATIQVIGDRDSVEIRIE